MFQYAQSWYDWYYYIDLKCDYCGKVFKREVKHGGKEYNCCSYNCCINLMAGDASPLKGTSCK